MGRKKSEDEPCGNWMDTYGDMVTLLLTFFIMLFSMSSVNEEKWQQLVMAFTNNGKDTQQVILTAEGDGDQMIDANRGDVPPPGTGDSLETTDGELPQDFDELYKYLKAYVEKNNMQGSVEVSKGVGTVYIRFQDNILFDPDSPDLKQSSYKLLDFLGNGLVSVEDQILTVNINGHTAAVPGVENYKVSDWRLSGERASSVAIYLEEKKGFEPQKLLPIGYGKNFPIADNATVEGQRKNRRVDMLVISEESDMSSEDVLKRLLSGTFDPEKYPVSAENTADILLPQTDGTDSSSSQGTSEPALPPAVTPNPSASSAAATPPEPSEPAPASSIEPAPQVPEKDKAVLAEEDTPAQSDGTVYKDVSPYADG